MDKRALRSLALEIVATDNSQVVKLAGLWRRFRNWWRGFRSSEYKEQIDKLREDNQEAINLSKQIDDHLREMTSSIKDGDVAGYTASSNEAKKLMLKLTEIISKNNHETRALMHHAYQEAKKSGALSSFKPEHNDVDWNKKYEDRPLKSFDWYKEVPNKIHMSQPTRSGMLKAIRDSLEKAGIKNPDFYLEEGDSIFEDASKAILDGNLVYAQHRVPAQHGNLATKTKRGDSVVTVDTQPFRLPKDGPAIRLKVLLNDTGTDFHGGRSNSTLALVRTLVVKTLDGGKHETEEEEGASDEGIRDEEYDKKEMPEEPEVTEETIDKLDQEEQERLERAQQAAEDEQARREAEAEAWNSQYASSDHILKKEAKLDPNASRSLSPKFWKEFVAMAGRLNAEPEDLAKVIMSESAFDPGAVNEQQGRAIAKGLNQITRAALPAIGMSTQQWDSMENMPAEAQLPYIERYFRAVANNYGIKKWDDATQLYIANFSPASLTRPNEPFYHKGTKAYEMNAGLDRDRKGYISASDLSVSTSRSLPAHIKESIAQASGLSESNTDEIEELTSRLLSSYGSLSSFVGKAIMKKALPESDVLIRIKANSFVDKVEFARITSNILRKSLDVKSYICSNGNVVELQCCGLGTSDVLTPAVASICEVIANEMNRKYGLEILAIALPDMLSKHGEVDVEMVVRNYRTFSMMRLGNG